MKPLLFVHRIHEHADEWVCTIVSELDPKDWEVLKKILDASWPAARPEAHWPY